MNQAIPPLQYADKIIHAACQYFQCSENELKSREYIEKMKIVVYLLRTEAMMKYSRIGQRFEFKSHSWPREMAGEIEIQKDIYRHISVSIAGIMKIVAILCEQNTQ